MSRSVFFRTDISAKAKGIYAFLINNKRPMSHKDLHIFFKEGRDAISSGLKELTEKNLVKLDYVRDEKGQFKGTKLVVIEKEKREWVG